MPMQPLAPSKNIPRALEGGSKFLSVNVEAGLVVGVAYGAIIALHPLIGGPNSEKEPSGTLESQRDNSESNVRPMGQFKRGRGLGI